MDFREFKAEIVRAEIGKMDFGTNLKTMEFSYKEKGVRSLKTEKGEMSLNTWAMKQLCSNLGVPYNYEKKQPPEIETQVNYFLKQSDLNVIMRTRNNEIRAILPNWWKIYDHIDLVNAMEPSVAKFNMLFMVQTATETQLECRIIFPQEVRGASDLDTISGGVRIANSEVGDTELAMNFLLFQKICTNGAISPIDNQPIFNFKRRSLDKQFVDQRIRFGFEKAAEVSEAKINWLNSLQNIKLDMSAYDSLFAAMEEDQVLSSRFLKKLKEDPLAEPNMYQLVSNITRQAQMLSPNARVRVETWVGTKFQKWFNKTGILQ